MNEIICPHCTKAFNIDEAGYAEILKQVRDSEFEQQLNERLSQAQTEKANALELAQTQSELAMVELKAEHDLAIQTLRSQISEKENSIQSTVNQAMQELEKEKSTLENDLNNSRLEKQNAENLLKEKYETQIRDRDDAIERLRDMKSKLSTKMVGETLEQHCEVEFNKIRPTAFQGAYFAKDNDASTGSKGDYIFKEHDENGTEIVSIMFDMKNESDSTATKSKNDDFLDKLDKDRTEKGCEYAVLVSLLEPDNELYNTGIVDVSYRHTKMYVIRPQLFIPMITLIRNAAMHSLKYKTELAQVRSQNIDVTNFESDLADFKKAFGKNFDLASRNLPHVKVVPTEGANVYDILRADKLVVTKSALPLLEARFGSGTAAKTAPKQTSSTNKKEA